MRNHGFDSGALAASRGSLFRTCSILALGLGAASMTIAATPAPLTDAAKVSYLKQHMVSSHQKWRPTFLEKPPHSAARANFVAGFNAAGAGTTIPYWTTMITSPLNRATYNVSMVGGSPYALNPSNTNVPFVPVVLRIHVGGFVLDPTKPSNCDRQSPAQRFFNSPLFHQASFTSNGVNVSAVPGGTQLISAFQRANFWGAVHGTNYGVTLAATQPNPIVVDWTPTDPRDFVVGANDNCGGVTPVAVLDINEFDSELQSIAAAYANTTEIPVTLADDVAIYVNQNINECCVLGYHNAISAPGGTQVYATGAYFDTNHVFGPDFADTTIWSHELGELIDDPFVQSIPGVQGGTASDLTPAWGHTGQVGGCQDNLETGDPLTPDQAGGYHNYAVVGVGGFVYHYQDLAFHDWFFRTPSSGTGGKYSFVGNFISTQGRCH